jgi:prophage regulatory protein
MRSDMQLITWKELRQLVPYSRTHIARLEKQGLFPQRVPLSKKRIAWVRAEVEAWITERKASRPSPVRAPTPATSSASGSFQLRR